MKFLQQTILIVLTSAPFFSWGQYSTDALLFSETNQTTTARSLATGNALGALGGDLSVANTNPAGLGIYRRTEISLSVGALFDNTRNAFETANTSTNGRTSQVTFGGAGFLIANRLSKYSKWRFVNVGLSINRLSNFARNIELSGITEGSRILSIAEAANGAAPGNLNPYEAGLAYDTYLIDEDPLSPNTYVTPVIASDQIEKQQTIQQTGGVNELGISLAANYNNKLYIGATVGIDFLSFRDDRYYYEYATNDTIPFEAMNFSEFRSVEGVGINLKLGFIYRVNKFLRFGAAIHTPTAYRLTETYDTEMYGRVYYGSILQENTFKPDQVQEIQHTLATPWTFSGNIGAIIAKRGFIGVEVAYQDYSWASFGLLNKDITPNQYIRTVNRAVSDTYQGTVNVKVGGEISFGMARLRLGYRFQSSPYQTSVPNVNDFRHDISGGIGFKWKHFSLDIGYNHTLREFEYLPYVSFQEQRVVGKRQTGQAMITLGVALFRDKNS